MMMRRLIISTKVLALAGVAVVTMQAQPPGAAVAAAGPDAPQTAPAGGGQRGGGQRGGSRADAPILGAGTLVAGAWGSDPTAVDSRGWGWMAKSYVSAGF